MNKRTRSLRHTLCILYVCLLRPSQQFSVTSGRFLGLTNPKQWIECLELAQGHNTVPLMKLEPATPRSQVERHSSTETEFIMPAFLICYLHSLPYIWFALLAIIIPLHF